jgi:hypothetical protein
MTKDNGGNMAAARQAILQELRSQFGPRWPWWTVGIVVGTFWPIFVYRNQIEFRPAAFVQEYVKAATTGLLLWSVLRIAVARRDKVNRRDFIRSRMIQELLLPIGEMVASLDRMRICRSGPDYVDNCRSLRSAWASSKNGLDASQGASPLADVHREFGFVVPQIDTALGRIENLLKEITSSGSWDQLNQEEWRETRDALLSHFGRAAQLYTRLGKQ